MGEARRRQASERMFGKMKNPNLPRGIVITSPMDFEGSSLTIRGASLHPQELRFSLLYWDKLSWPDARIIGSPLTRDEEVLLECGVLERPVFRINGDVAQGALNGYIQVFKDKCEADPGLWSLSEGTNSLSAVISRSAFDHVDGLSVQLARAIPIPGADMSVEQILKFKEKRKDELHALRACLETSTQHLHEFGGPEDYLQHQVNQMRDACADLLRVSSEWQSPFYLADIGASTSVSLADLGAAWFAGKQIYDATGSISASMVSGALAGAVSISATPKLRWVKKNLGPYKYVYKMHKELV